MPYNSFEDEIYIYVINELSLIREERGRIGLLPQNLPSELLFIIESHALDFLENHIESLIILDCTTDLLLTDTQRESDSWSFSQEKHTKSTVLYAEAIENEYLRRIKAISIPEDKLPTVKNIFQKNRELAISNNDTNEFREYYIIENANNL